MEDGLVVVMEGAGGLGGDAGGGLMMKGATSMGEINGEDGYVKI